MQRSWLRAVLGCDSRDIVELGRQLDKNRLNDVERRSLSAVMLDAGHGLEEVRLRGLGRRPTSDEAVDT